MGVAQAFGISKVLAFDIVQKRVEFARGFGADYASLVPPKPEGSSYHEWAEAWKVSALAEAGVDPWGVDVVVEASGAESAMHAGMSFVHMGGICKCFHTLPSVATLSPWVAPDVQAGLGDVVMPFPMFSIVAKEIDVIGTVRYTAGCYQVAIDLMSKKRIDLTPMITAVFPLTRSVEALETVRKGENLKVVIMNQQ